MQNLLSNNLLKALFACVILSGIFALYLIFIGTPRTTARYLYNQAIVEIQKGETSAAKVLLQEAYTEWPEEYISQELAKLDK